MPNLTSVGITSGVPTSGTGTVSTIDNLPNLTLTVAPHQVTNAGTFAVQAAATQSGTWTVQPGNTANTTAWKVDGSAVTQPVSGTVTANQGTANSTPWTAKVTDGTNAMTIKAASTGGAATTDVAAVVTIRDQNVNGPASSANSTPVVQSGFQYNTVAASSSAQALHGGGSGATGDRLWSLLIIPGTTSPGAVSITDGSGSAITVFAGGATSVGSLVPFSVVVNARSTSGAWKVTTGTNVTAIASGDFT